MSAQLYKPAEACKMAEVAPYVLRYWETEFPVLSEGKDKASARSYTERDVKIITRIRELLYDEGFTVAGAKKRLDAEIAEGRFEDGLKAAPSAREQRTPRSAAATLDEVALVRDGESASRAPFLETAGAAAFVAEPAASPAPEPRPAVAAPAFPERKQVLRELKEIAKLLDRAGKNKK